VTLPPRTLPHLFIVVDTEEEFDWSAPFSRTSTSVSAMRDIGLVQDIFDRFGSSPTYVIDYPVASKEEGYGGIVESASDGRCVIGAHLHPWVNPPFDEPVSNRNSFLCNLSPELQARKIDVLCDLIEERTGVRPRTFKAGRYGLGAATISALDASGFEVDTSINPFTDFSGEGGPDFREFDSQPLWLAHARQLLELPCTHGFVGVARRRGQTLRRLAEARVLRAMRAPGLLARGGIVDQVMLSPEGNTLSEMIALTRALLVDGVRTFTLSFHSPSVVPGHTPYVRTRADLEEFLRRVEGYLEFFFGEIRGVADTHEAFRRTLLVSEQTST